ncbi:Mis12 protein-domain-containing protein [Nemania abortiva]|nr:Mis12 protein-domain-containing protein [Nemania abortiva]
MTMSAISETELLTEHFGYPPVSLIDDIINSVNVLAERALNSVEQGLLNASPATLGFKAPKSQSQSQSQQDDAADSPAERAKNEVEAGTHQLETLLCASIDRNFDKFEIYVLRNIFTVRPPELCNWIRLSHYDGLDFSSSASIRAKRNNNNSNDNGDASQPAPNDAPTIESVTLLRRRLRESMRLNALLTAEHTRNEALLEDLRRLVGDTASTGPQVKTEGTSPVPRRSVSRDLNANTVDNQDASGHEKGKQKAETKSPFAFLHQKGDLASSSGGAAPLATTAAFALSQLQALRSLSTALSNLTPDLKASSSSASQAHDGEDGDDSRPSTAGPRGWRRERVEYVETATRRHLETVHGLELGKHGEVRDGEWQGPGRSLARGEVEGLERVVEILDGDGNGNGVPGPGGGGDGEPMDES